MNARCQKLIDGLRDQLIDLTDAGRWTLAGRCWLTVIATALLPMTAFAQDIRSAPDVEYQIQSLRAKGDVLGARMHADMPVLSGKYHWQGIARHPDPNQPYLYATASVSCDNGGGVLAIMKIDSAWPVDNRLRSNRLGGQRLAFTNPPVSDEMVRIIRFPDMHHPGALQTAGEYMVMGIYGDADCSTGTPKKEARIYDVSDPLNPTTIDYLPTSSVGDLGIVQLSNGHWLIANYIGGIQFFYSINSGDLRSNPGWYTYNWNIDTAPDGATLYDCGDSIFENCPPQALNLVLQADDPATPDNERQVYMLALKNTEDFGNGTDLLGVYTLDFGTPPFNFSVTVTHQFDEQFPNDTSGNFRAGSSVWVAPNGELVVYKCPHYGNAGPPRILPFVEHSSFRGSWAGAWPFPCMGHVQLYNAINLNDATITNYSAGIDVADYLYEDYSRLNNIDPVAVMGDAVSSVAWTLPVGCTARLWQNANYGGNYLDLPGTGAPEWIDDLSAVNWTNTAAGNPNNKISSIQFVGDCPGRKFHADPGGTANIATSLAFLFPGDSCSVLNVRAGDYPGQITIDQPVILRPTGGRAVIGGP